jgi:hypothetical protein
MEKLIGLFAVCQLKDQEPLNMIKKMSLVLLIGLTLTSTMSTQAFADPTKEEIEKARKQAEKRHLENIKASLPGYSGRQTAENKLAEMAYKNQINFAEKQKSVSDYENLKQNNKALGDLGLIPRDVRNIILKKLDSNSLMQISNVSHECRAEAYELDEQRWRNLIERMPRDQQWNLLEEASNNGNARIVELISQYAPDTLSAKDNNGATPAHWAADRGHANVIEVLAKYARDTLSAKDNDNLTPAHWAAFSGHANVIEVLAKYVPESLSAKNNLGQTPAHWTTSCGHANVIEVLAKYAPETLGAKDNDNLTPAHWAALRGDAHMTELLAKYAHKTLEVTKK